LLWILLLSCQFPDSQSLSRKIEPSMTLSYAGYH